MPRRKESPPPPTVPALAKPIALRRLKEALDQIPSLEGLNHRDVTFTAWRANLSNLLNRNWPGERLPDFFDMVMKMPGAPDISSRDKEVYRRGHQLTRKLLERILRDERETAELEDDRAALEVFIPPGSQHDAYKEIRNVIVQATSGLIIVDNYMDTSIFPLLTNAPAPVAIKLLTYSIPPDFAVEAKKFVQQHKRNLEIKRDRADFHDRFIILDGKNPYHLGHSIKDAGSKAMMISEMADPKNVANVITTYNNTWATAVPFCF